MNRLLLVLLTLLSGLSLADPVPPDCPRCSLQSRPKPPACRGDPVNLLTGFTYHGAVDVDLDTGDGRFVLTRYFMPNGYSSYGGAKSPLLGVIGQEWIGDGGVASSPASPFGVDQGATRPVWSNDLFSFVAPTTASGLGNIAIVFEGDFSWSVFGRTGSPGMQAPSPKTPGTRVRLEALSDGYRVIKASGEQWFYKKLMGANPNVAPALLSEVRSAQGMLRYSISYPTSGSCLNRPSAVTFSTGATLEPTYDTSCRMVSLGYRPAGGTATVLATYAYSPAYAGRVVSGGPTADALERYDYPDAGYGWSFVVADGPEDGGAAKATHNYFGSYPNVSDYVGHGRSEAFSVQPASEEAPPDPSFMQCSVVTDDYLSTGGYGVGVPLQRDFMRRVTVQVEHRGALSDAGVPGGTASQTSEYTSFNDDVFGEGASQFAEQVDSCAAGESCVSGTLLQTYVPLASNPGNVCSNGRDGGSPAVPFATRDRRGNWAVRRMTATAHGEQMEVVAARGMSGMPAALADGGVDHLAAGSLEHANLNTVPQLLGSVRLNSRRELPSSLAGPTAVTIFDQRFVDGGTVGGVPSRFKELEWQYGNTALLNGTVVARYQGTFARRARVCSGGSIPDPSNRVLRVEGPCVISDPNATACTGSTFPVTEYHYYASDDPKEHNRGRLKQVSRYPRNGESGGACGLELTTVFDDYTAEGIPTMVTDPAGVKTKYVFSGKRMLSRTVGDATATAATTTYAYEADGSLRSIQYPQLNFEVFCRHGTAADATCDFTKPLLPYVVWKGKSGSADGSGAAERVQYAYWADGSLKEETFLNGLTEVRVVKRHNPDLSGRPTWDGAGLAWGTLATKRKFDANGNLIAEGTTFTGAPDFCDLQTPSPLCSFLTYDRADRLAQVELNPTGTSGSALKTCIDYDRRGNVRRVVPGCSPSETCSINHSNGATSTCSSSPETDYDIDDFGNVVRVKGPWNGTSGFSETRLEYNALGLVTRRQTQVMRNAGVWEELSWDQLGRLTARKRNAGGTLTQLYAFEWDTAINGTGCPTTADARTTGRLGVRTDTFGKTGYKYDQDGRVLVEWRQRDGSPASCVADASSLAGHPSTSYTWTANGNLQSIRYPHGRTVSYVYGSGGLTDRVQSIAANSWNGASWGGATILVTDVAWEPYGGLRRHRGANIITADYSMPVERRLVSAGANIDSCSTDGEYPDASDGTGRLGAITVRVQHVDGASGPGMRKVFGWTGDQLSSEKSCFQWVSQTTESVQSYALDKLGRLTGEQRTNLPGMTHGFGGATVSPTLATSYTLSARGNRSAYTVDGCPRNITHGSGAQQDILNVVVPNGSTACQGRFSGNTHVTDADGRVTRIGTAWWWWYEDFGYDDPSRAALDSVFHTVSIARVNNSNPYYPTYTTASYQYYYDAFNRRRLKNLPTGAGQEFYYDLGHQLLTETSPPTVNGGLPFAVEDYVWLDGAPVAIIRGALTLGSGGAWVRGVETPTTSCSKLSDGGFCGTYFLVTDAQARPVLMVRQSTGEVTQAATYDAYGHANRVPMVAGTNDNQPATLGTVSLPSGSKWVRLRANYIKAPSNPVTLGGATIFPASSVPVASWVSGYVGVGTASSVTTAVGGVQQFPTPAGGVQTTEVEYFRTSAGLGLFTQLRFPGQYLDPETDLIENWNRYYDASTGRYLAREPMLQSPAYVRSMASSAIQVPSYAYAANNPLRYVDPDGLRIVWNQSNSDLARQVDRLRSTPTGNALWERLDARPETYELREMTPYWDRGSFIVGRTTPQRGNDHLCRATTYRSFEGLTVTVNGIREILDPATVIGHELTHAETDVLNPGLDRAAREQRSRDVQEQIFWELSP